MKSNRAAKFPVFPSHSVFLCSLFLFFFHLLLFSVLGSAKLSVFHSCCLLAVEVSRELWRRPCLAAFQEASDTLEPHQMLEETLESSSGSAELCFAVGLFNVAVFGTASQLTGCDCLVLNMQAKLLFLNRKAHICPHPASFLPDGRSCQQTRNCCCSAS